MNRSLTRRIGLPAVLLLLAATAFATDPSVNLRDYDARRALRAQAAPAQAAPAQLQALGELSRGARDLAVTFDDVTGATRSIYDRAGYLTSPAEGPAEEIALTYLQQHREALGLRLSDLEGLEVADRVPSAATGATHLYLRQVHQGLPVYGAQLQVHVNRDGRILSVNNGFSPGLADAAVSPRPALTAEQAVAAASRVLGLTGRLESGFESGDPVSNAQLMWLPVRAGEARLVWSFRLATPDEDHVFDLTVDAHSGEVLTSFDLVEDASYLVYPQPVESPEHITPLPPGDARTVVVNPADPTASPLGWHDDGTTSYTIMRGNNVHAYDDIDTDNSPPSSEPDCGSSLDCDFPIDLSAEPSTYTSAAVANLFYWTNLVHDVQYHYGFDEDAGNFQVDNFGRGGAGGDDVRAQAQDGSRTCNGNFGVSPDGNRPRLRMYLCNRATPGRDGDFDTGVLVHEYGHGISGRQMGGPSTVGCLNNRQQGGEGWSDYMGLWYTIEEGDQGTDARGTGSYLFDKEAGIRPQQYSTDPAVNDYTYESIDGKSVPHGVGSVWAQALWEITWALIDAHGFDPDLFDVTAGAGNHRAMLYVNEGLKNTTCSPTFVDARDGILQAATDNFGGDDVCLLWETFAAFGLGTDAVSGGEDSTTPTNGFSMPSSCATYQTGSLLAATDKRDQAVSGFTAPRVVLGPLADFSPYPATLRGHIATSTYFRHSLDLWNYLGSLPAADVAGYFVVEDGAAKLGSLEIEAGATEGDHDWQTVTFGTPFSSVPVVLAQVMSARGSSAVTTRIRNVTASGFDLRLQEEEGNDDVHVDESIHWIAVETGTTTIGGHTFVVGRTANAVTEDWFDLGIGAAGPSPLLLAAMQTYDGADPATVRMRPFSPTSLQIRIEEEQSDDSETGHTTEVVGYVLIGP